MKLMNIKRIKTVKQCRLSSRTLYPALIIIFLFSCCNGEDIVYDNSLIADPDNAQISIIYHSGVSGFSKKMAGKLECELIARNYAAAKVEVKSEFIINDNQRAIVLISPVYGATTMPSIRDFIDVNAPVSTPVFALLTGFFPGTAEDKDLPILNGMLEEFESGLTDGVKIGIIDSGKKINEKINSLCDKIVQTLAEE